MNTTDTITRADKIIAGRDYLARRGIVLPLSEEERNTLTTAAAIRSAS